MQSTTDTFSLDGASERLTALHRATQGAYDRGEDDLAEVLNQVQEQAISEIDAFVRSCPWLGGWHVNIDPTNRVTVVVRPAVSN